MSKDYIKELGIDSSKATPVADATENSTEDFVQEPNTEGSTEDTNTDTEPNISEELKKQIEGLEKRITDKDEYINLLREQSKQQEAETSTEEVDTGTDFWDDPEKTVQDLQQTIKLQSMQIQETVYANTVEDYWKTVSAEALKSAVATDDVFAKEFNSSSEPYRVAYEYLSKQTAEKSAKELTMREEIKKEVMKELGLDKPKKEGVPNMGNMGGSNSDKVSEAPSDGFTAVFGKKY